VINWLTGQINDRNGLLDEAIASYESVLATKIPERGFDFSLDYEVINLLANALYNRARVEPLDSEDRVKFTLRSIAEYRKTLAIDSENVAAHYGLGLAYSEFTRIAGKDRDKDPGFYDGEHSTGAEVAYNWETLTRYFQAALTPGRDKATRMEHLKYLTMFLETAGDPVVERPRDGSKLEPLYDAVEALGRAWDAEADSHLKYAEAKALAGAHKSLHKLLKPDETAEGRAVANARKNDPAADRNAQSIVIHSLHRPGAPGVDLDRPAAASATADAAPRALKEGNE
jgi:hypothetical protein